MLAEAVPTIFEIEGGALGAGALELRIFCHRQVPAIGAEIPLTGLAPDHQLELAAFHAIRAPE